MQLKKKKKPTINVKIRKVSWETVEEVPKMWTVVRKENTESVLYHKQTVLFLKVKDLKVGNN